MSSQINDFPTKEQAIIVTAVDGLQLKDYVSAIAEIVEPKNILFASRLANNRVCIYVSSVALVDEVVTKYSQLSINDLIVGVRRLINPARRIILSNVCPSIPHDVFINQIKTLGFNIVSPMSFLKARLEGENYAHIRSFRRQIFVQPNDDIELPASLIIKYDNTPYRIFYCYDNVCFKCRQAGHLASECEKASNSHETTELSVNVPSGMRPGDGNHPVSEVSVEDNLTTSSSINSEPTASGSKRQVTSSSDNSPDVMEGPLDFSQKSLGEDRQPKKLRSSDSLESLTPIPELLAPAKELIEDSGSPFPLNFDNIAEIMQNIFEATDPIEYVQRFTNDVEGVIQMLYEIYPTLTKKSIKNRCLKVLRPVLEFANYIWSPILQRDIELLESVQRRATRIPFGRIRPQYADRLVMMGLPTLSNRRKRGDLILTFRALKDPQSPIRHLFPLNTLSRTRGHCFKLVKDKFRSTVRQHFISNRVFETWNALPASIVEADTVTNFKIKFDNYNG
ncbi:hypothetical protein Zmor_007722 [Zophobas morio]|uniref:CCHC-type domain-containing protein n=1 Tax=Zophobas morio TaxID=2755281 RepID=A0AA38ISM0_9CUCU|nr:hypothetical protein Zmor_007722 [Zophobas morio]